MWGFMPHMQIRIYPENEKRLLEIRRDRQKFHLRKDSIAEIANELLRRALMMRTLKIK